MSQGHNVYKVQYHLGLQDPLIPGIEYHTGIFIETDTDGGGYIHHVIGDIASANGSLYDENEERPAYVKCTEWVEQSAIPALEQAGILHKDGIVSSTEAASGSQTGTTSSPGWVWNGKEWVW